MVSSLRTALGFFTIAPVKHRGLDRDNAGRVMMLAPAVGALMVAAAGLVVVVARYLLDPHGRLSVSATFGHAVGSNVPYDVGLLPAVFGIATIAILTRGLHLDGLADTFDGLASYRDRQTALTIMRKPDLGPLGMTAVTLVLLAEVAALTQCINNHRGTTSLLAAVLTGRLAMTLSCTPRTPSARSEGFGSIVAGSVSRLGAVGVAFMTTAVACLGALLDPHSDGRLSETLHVLVAVVVGVAVAHLFRSHCVRRFGGITGDVLGALCELATVVALLVMATAW